MRRSRNLAQDAASTGGVDLEEVKMTRSAQTLSLVGIALGSAAVLWMSEAIAASNLNSSRSNIYKAAPGTSITMSAQATLGSPPPSRAEFAALIDQTMAQVKADLLAKYDQQKPAGM
jgi:hypothetical protein